MIKAKRNRNSTALDEIALKYGLVRETNETIDNFFKRTLKACLQISVQEKDSFYKSLGYLTSLQDKDVFLINRKENLNNLNIEITSSELIIYEVEEVLYKKLLRELKYLRDFKTILEEYFIVEVLDDTDSWELLKTENLMPQDSRRNYLKYETDNYQSLLPKDKITEIKDFQGELVSETTEIELINDSSFYIQEDELFIKGSRGYGEVTFSYDDFPFKLKWLPIKAIALNDLSFENISKDETGNLTQKGAKIFNKVLEKQNTYWGK
jgi:hypothetical protein